jgi:WD40 repeat protein
LWDVTRQEPWGGLLHHSHTINSIAFAPDSRMLATASDDHTVALWDMDGDRPVVKHRLPHPDVTSVAFCPGAAPLLASVGDGVVALWNTQTGQPEDEHPDMPQSWARSAAFSPDGATLAIADADGYVHLWSVPGRQWTGKLTTEAYQDSGDMAFSPDGTYLAVTDERIIQIWDVNSREAVAHLPGHSNSVEALAFSPVQPLLLASGGHDGAIRLWRETDWSGSAQQPGTGSLEAIACSPDGHHLAILTGAGDLLLCDPATGEIRFSHPMVDNVGRQRTLTFSPSSELLAVSDDRRGLHLIPVNTPDAGNWFTVHLAGQRILTQQISPDSKLIAILATSPRTEPDSIVVWDIGAQRQLGRIPLPGRPDFFDFAGPDRLLVSVNGAQAVYTWETP